MKNLKAMNRKQFAALVVRQLEKHKISCVLVGGACVSIYTNEKHESRDLDFISPNSQDSIASALAEIGFVRKGRYFAHPDAELYVEFPSGPVGIGHKVPVQAEGEIKVGKTIVKMLSPTQSVMDRLSAFFHWNDRRSLIHAIWICQKHPVSLEKVKAWASKENAPEKFEQFLAEYRKLQS